MILKSIFILSILVLFALQVAMGVEHNKTHNTKYIYPEFYHPPIIWDPDRLISTTPNELEVEEGKTVKQKLAFFNNESGKIAYSLHIYDSNGIDCYAGQTCDGITIIFDEAQVEIDKDKIVQWTIIYKPETGTVTSGESITKLFTLKIECSDGKSTLSPTQCDENKYLTDVVINILK